VSYFAKSLGFPKLLGLSILLISAAAPAQQFDLRNVPSAKTPPPKTQSPKITGQSEAKPNALDIFLFEGFYKNPVGNYIRSDEWDEDFPIIAEEGRLIVASSLVMATRNEVDARALSAVLASYRDGADKALPPSAPPAVTFGSSAVAADTAEPSSRSGFGTDRMGSKSGHSDPAISAKQNGAQINDRLGVRIVANLAIYRSCSGALVAYLNHLSDDDAKAASWARMIRRSLGMAALPPDHSCI
jgi:hypothetical protein